MKIYFSIFIYLVASLSLTAQINKPSLSPKTTIQQQVGLANINLSYSQPSKKGRIIFGSLIPYGKVWRTGANAATKITLDKEASFANHLIPAGTYGLYTIPNKTEWTIIFHKKSNLWGDAGYQQENDFIRFSTPSKTTTDTSETLNIYFENYTVDGADFVIVWENTKVVIPVKVDSDAIIQQQIDAEIINSKKVAAPQTYFDAAQYYYEKNKDLTTAFKWFSKAEALRPQAFWYTYYKGELAYKLKKYKIAKLSAEKCLKDAKNSKASDFGYIAKCSLLLKEVDKKRK
ncbi:DUF2911 domain-containing protein [Tenacibaculum maritimum]|uniref:DUF2911 domain-containing protein n=1 Tax=Tenacibaculum maritimum NCIMB 2154 TaxID=1349785 RepID=A0A2H1E641_9FLAO|nr:DUF2911 domain-containing protein [Tenacibaculum maritimum]MCD9561853.1 DUF2911 domain-containing protein [Tenacibaculum maritimum]MCD9565033.1 DUF2911 domain-containing protein [Tenacibaculum maritimum]MCD9579006.1 DUF2911 domain-containing protein [Tenacibaculum maritimum]MCD9595860.1 DUF2911 domain-containing protein [Tenacibaculum maritimum]MCD9613103.1 DUF2911 domain-containing protein [Tenacibaculum maritimum]